MPTQILMRKEAKALELLGADIALARGRRGLSVSDIHRRTELSRVTISRIEKGDGGVSIGNYVKVLKVLGLLDNLSKMAADDEMGRKLQDIEHNKAAKKVGHLLQGS